MKLNRFLKSKFSGISLLSIILWLSIQNCLFGQKPFMINLTDEDGLPSNTVYKVVEDKKGYLWIATANGLCRYDGTNFKKINLKGTSSNDILDVQIDKENHVWTLNSAYEIGIVENEIYKKVNLPKISSTDKIYEFCILDSSIYYCSVDHIVGKFYLLKTGLKFNSQTNIVLCEDNPDCRNISCFITINITNQKDNISFHKYEENKFVELTVNNDIVGNLYQTYTNKKSSNLNLEKNLFQFNLDTVYINGVKLGYINQNKNFLNTTKLGVRSFQFDSLLFINDRKYTWLINLNTKNSYPIFVNDYILSIYKSQINQFYFCTQNSGLYISNSLLLFLSNFNSHPEFGPITSLMKDDHSITFGTGNGEVISINQNKKKDLNIPFIGKIRNLRIYNNSLLIGGDCGLIQSEITKFYPISNHQISSNSIKNVFLYNNKDLLISSSENYFIKNIQSEKFQKLDIIKSNTNFFKGKIISMVETSPNLVYIGRMNGLEKYIKDSLLLRNPNFNGIAITNLDFNKSKNELAAYGNNAGLYILQEDKVKYHYSDSSLCFRQIYFVKFITNDIISIASNNGLVNINLRSNKKRIIDLCDGIPSEQILCLDADSNNIYCGTSKGYFIYPIRDIMNDQTNASIDIESVKLFTKDGYQAFSQNIPYYNNNIEIQTNVISLLSKGRTKIKYRIKGKEDSWIVSDDKTIRLVSLSSGNYSLEIIGIDENGEDTKNVALVNFTILPPWWKTKWFYFLSLLGLAALGSGTVYWRIQSQYKNKLKEKEIVAQLNGLRMQALQNQMNPHFIFNAMNAIQGFLVNAEFQKARDYLIAFARLIRHIFDFSKLKEVSLSEELSFLETYIALEKLRIGDKVSHEIILSDKVKNQINDILIPPLIIQPMVENAFKHGLFHKKGQGHLVLSFDFVENILIVSIKDDGIGRKKAQELANHNPGSHLSSSLKATIERLELYNEGKVKHSVEIRDLNDEQNGISGTIVILNFTIKFDEFHKISS